MERYTIRLDTIGRVKTFVNLVNRFDNDFDLLAGRYVIDAKSIMGIFSLDLEDTLTLQVHGEVSPVLEASLEEYLA